MDKIINIFIINLCSTAGRLDLMTTCYPKTDWITSRLYLKTEIRPAVAWYVLALNRL